MNVNYDVRDEFYGKSGNIQCLVNKRLIDIKCRQNGPGHWVGENSYDIELVWEDYAAVFKVPDLDSVPLELCKHLNCRLVEWDAIPNHAADLYELLFENCELPVNINIWGRIILEKRQNGQGKYNYPEGGRTQMYSFRNDYTENAHPDILKALTETNYEQDLGYGLDKHCISAAEMIKTLIDNKNADVHFLCGGTQVNLTALAAFLRPYEAVIAADTAHIATHETGAIEATGHKIIEVRGECGKITCGQIAEQLEYHADEHMVKPRLVKISNSTELGTVYGKKELAEISGFCKENSLLLYVDGARLGVALDACEGSLTLADMAELTDAFYIGGTKNGALMGEALVIVNDALKSDFRYMIKQRGGMLAKGRALGVQFETLFANGLYFRIAESANRKARILSEGVKAAGYELLVETQTNQVFPVLPDDVIEKLSEKFAFQFWSKAEDGCKAMRFVTSGATDEKAVVEFCAEIAKMPKR